MFPNALTSYSLSNASNDMVGVSTLSSLDLPVRRPRAMSHPLRRTHAQDHLFDLALPSG